MRPIRERKPLPQVGQRCVDAVILVLVALALSVARSCSAWRDLRSSAVWAPLTIELHMEGLSEARNCQDSVLMLKSFRESRLSGCL